MSKFTGDRSEDPVRHCKTCIAIREANGQDDQEYWLKAFLATLRGIAIDWYTNLNAQHKTTWSNLKKAFQEEFKLLRDDNEIVVEIYNTKQGKNESVRAYNSRFKELLNKMKNQPTDGLKKRWFTEGLIPSLRKMKVVPTSSYIDTYNRTMDIENENKTFSREKR